MARLSTLAILAFEAAPNLETETPFEECMPVTAKVKRQTRVRPSDPVSDAARQNLGGCTRAGRGRSADLPVAEPVPEAGDVGAAADAPFPAPLFLL